MAKAESSLARLARAIGRARARTSQHEIDELAAELAAQSRRSATPGRLVKKKQTRGVRQHR
jgi:hypothetical protein